MEHVGFWLNCSQECLPFSKPNTKYSQLKEFPAKIDIPFLNCNLFCPKVPTLFHPATGPQRAEPPLPGQDRVREHRGGPTAAGHGFQSLCHKEHPWAARCSGAGFLKGSEKLYRWLLDGYSLWYFMVFYGYFIWYFMVLYGILWYFMVFYGILWHFIVFYGIFHVNAFSCSFMHVHVFS